MNQIPEGNPVNRRDEEWEMTVEVRRLALDFSQYL